ncbi:MAG: Sporulation protein YpeB [Eubacteriales bacterium SKADARSKE-1]|nr:Sporulation protein YpeB [Eubacteriales bacterium SKADARSKE-1]
MNKWEQIAENIFKISFYTGVSMGRTIKLRDNIKIISFSVATLVVLITFAISGYTLAHKYKRDLEYGYLRALNELSDYVSNLEITLNKGIYANTSPQQFGLASKLMTQSMGAKMALEQLPLEYQGIDNINKFISQVGDFSSYLYSNTSREKTATDEETANLKSLGNYAKTINSNIKEMMARFDSEKIDFGTAAYSYSNLSEKTQDDTVLATSFKEMNDSFTEYPTLIYDGPFSDHIMRQKSKFLENVPEVSVGDAQKRAENFLGSSVSEIQYIADTNGNLPVYKFKTNVGEISVTKSGGYINYVLCEKNVTSIKLDYNAAKQKAAEFMAKNNIYNMKESYYIINNGVCTINYAFTQDNVIYYPDLIKIGIALDNGDIVSFNATGYLMNHTKRQIPQKIMSQDKAQKSLSKNLVVKDKNLTIIPTDGLNETLCYEFECVGENEDRVLVYINAQTGLEEQIFIIIDSDDGVLVM